MTTKVLLETLKLADDGRVECSVATPDGGVVQGVIEQSFFEELAPPQPLVSPRVHVDADAVKRAEAAHQQRIVKANIGFFEEAFDKQWRLGSRVFVLR